MPTNSTLSRDSGLEGWEIEGDRQAGRDSLDERYTTTGTIGLAALKALNRLIARSIRPKNGKSKPFSLAIHFNGPHPPMLAPSKDLDIYSDKTDQLFVSPSISDEMVDSPYKDINGRNRIDSPKYKWDDRDAIADITAVYYAQITEIDRWIGMYLDRLELYGLRDNTMVVFTRYVLLTNLTTDVSVFAVGIHCQAFSFQLTVS